MANRPFEDYTIRIRIRMASMTETEDTIDHFTVVDLVP